MVWEYSFGRDAGGITFPSNAVVKSAYTTDAAGIAATRLRSDGNEYGTSPYIVGCGYAVHSTNDAFMVDGGVPDQLGLLLVRLSDGYSWTLMGYNTGPWVWIEPLALTCTELFATVQLRPGDASQAHAEIVRVRLDSLGSGMPPN